MKTKVKYKCCVCKSDIIIELERQPLDIEILASYIEYIICDKCANGDGKDEKGNDTKIR